MRSRLPLAGAPRVRADCARGPRPCPWGSCRHNLLAERRGQAPQLASCALDVLDANPDGLTLAQLAPLLGCTRQRVDQLARNALAKLREQ